MTEVRFYHLQRTALERALPQLLEKTLERDWRAVVKAASQERVEALNGQLWTYGRESFLPHGSGKDGQADRQPIWLTDTDENPNAASVLFLVDGAATDMLAQYTLCCELFDGNDATAIATAREHWRAYKTAGHALTYWQESDRGGWVKKADA